MDVYKDESLHIIKEGPLGSFANNLYVVIDRESGESVLVDAPAEPEVALRAAEGTRLTRILMTHTHPDHIAGLDVIKQRTGARLLCHPASEPWLSPSAIDTAIGDGDEIRVGQHVITALFTPGHTQGSTCFLLGSHLFSGDTLFPGGPGHSRSPEDLQQEIASIKAKLYILPDDTQVHPGHGDGTTIGKSKAEYAVFASKEHPAGLHGDVLWETS